MGCINSAPDGADSPKSVDNQASKKSEVSKKSKKKGDPDFPFVDPDHIVPDVKKLFEKMKVLGKGASCEVWHAKRNSDKEEFAMKVMVKDDKWNPILFKQEVDLLTQLDHPAILRYRDCYMDRQNFYVLTELCTGGELFDKIKDIKSFSEKIAAEYLKTIIEAMKHCHDKNIVHRDLKPENIVFKSKKQEQLVIIDFGDAKVVDLDAVYEDFVGTAFYLAPECVRDRKGWELKKSDMWTIGVIAYVLLTGRPPFFGRGNKEILRKILRGKVTFPSKSKVSKNAKDFIMGLLNSDCEKRMSADQALAHKWINNSNSEFLGFEVLNNLSNYTGSVKLKKVLVRMLAKEQTKDDLEELHRQFDAIDKDKSGTIDVHELADVIFQSSNAIDEEEAQRRASNLMQDIDQDNDGHITREEFIDARLSVKMENQDMIQKSFNHIDHDGDGFITSDELARLFNWTLADHVVDDMIKEIDENADGVISFEEFKVAMGKGAIANVLTPRTTDTKEMKFLGNKLHSYADKVAAA